MLSLIGSFCGLLIVGVPVAFVLGIASTVYLSSVVDMPLSVVPQRLFAGLDQFVLMSLPFFIMAGLLMNEAQRPRRLVDEQLCRAVDV